MSKKLSKQEENLNVLSLTMTIFHNFYHFNGIIQKKDDFQLNNYFFTGQKIVKTHHSAL